MWSLSWHPAIVKTPAKSCQIFKLSLSLDDNRNEICAFWVLSPINAILLIWARNFPPKSPTLPNPLHIWQKFRFVGKFVFRRVWMLRWIEKQAGERIIMKVGRVCVRNVSLRNLRIFCFSCVCCRSHHHHQTGWIRSEKKKYFNGTRSAIKDC